MEEPDARNGSVVDSFPGGPVAQAQALDAMLAKKNVKLDAIVELKVDEDTLLARIERTRPRNALRLAARCGPTTGPEAFEHRLEAYRCRPPPVSAITPARAC
jgi:adenylate kinase